MNRLQCVCVCMGGGGGGGGGENRPNGGGWVKTLVGLNGA